MFPLLERHGLTKHQVKRNRMCLMSKYVSHVIRLKQKTKDVYVASEYEL